MVAAYYLDTSALVKQYVDEVGSAWIRDQIASEAVVLIISQVLTVEMISAFNRRLREGSVTPDDYARMVTLFDNDLQTRYQIVRFDNPIVALARVLLEHHPLRAYDAVHLLPPTPFDRLRASSRPPAKPPAPGAVLSLSKDGPPPRTPAAPGLRIGDCELRIAGEVLFTAENAESAGKDLKKLRVLCVLCGKSADCGRGSRFAIRNPKLRPAACRGAAARGQCGRVCPGFRLVSPHHS
jgi:predicted nucleic acid-binding protein